MTTPRLSRRHLLAGSALGAAAFTRADGSVPGRFAERLDETPSAAEGPFYPDELPRDTDNDLLLINDSITPAVGEITHLSGRVLSTAGEPIRNAFVEIWQVDGKGSYIHSDGAGDDGSDPNFQGYGRFLTGSKGDYYFRTIKPVEYGVGRMRRVPHIHFTVSVNGERLLTSQIGVRGWKGNDTDGVFRRVDAERRDALFTDFTPLPGSAIGELAAEFDIVLGHTPPEPEKIEGGLGRRRSGRRGRSERRDL